jgi:putative RecB family exonuclease
MQNPFKLSVSKTKTYLSCAAKYRYSYELKLPKKVWSFHIFGTLVHEILEMFHLEYINGSQEKYNVVMQRVFKTALETYKTQMTKEAIDEAYRIVSDYLQKVMENDEELKSVLAVEKNFAIELGNNVNLNGMIDRVQLDKDGIYHVADYKTTKDTKYLKDDWFQLLTYAFVLCNEDPSIEKVRGSYIMLRHKFKYITKEFSRKEIDTVGQQYLDYAKMIEDEKLWRPNPSFLCGYCDYLDICDLGKEKVNSINGGANQKVNGKIGW